ncbi:hypothetical protein ACFWIO_34970 [Streptomyces diastatochromogenes]|uniref:hypothetical protein n=1 Tax=Streptomyces diastatochromogenes TaxID=42236 RepID=UPI0036545835
MNTDQQLDLDAIDAVANAATDGPWLANDRIGVATNPAGDPLAVFGGGEQDRADAAFVAAARTDVPALVAEVRRLQAREAAFTTLAERWQQMADHGDVAIGSFDGPAAATLDAEVGERGRTYRKAAADVRDVLAAGRIPHDLMTDDELDVAAPAAAGSAAANEDGGR